MTTRAEFEKWASENWIDGLPKMIALRAWQASRAAALEEAITILETYQVSVGNSAAGEIACEMTMANLREIRDEIRALAKGENNG